MSKFITDCIAEKFKQGLISKSLRDDLFEQVKKGIDISDHIDSTIAKYENSLKRATVKASNISGRIVDINEQVDGLLRAQKKSKLTDFDKRRQLEDLLKFNFAENVELTKDTLTGNFLAPFAEFSEMFNRGIFTRKGTRAKDTALFVNSVLKPSSNLQTQQSQHMAKAWRNSVKSINLWRENSGLKPLENLDKTLPISIVDDSLAKIRAAEFGDDVLNSVSRNAKENIQNFVDSAYEGNAGKFFDDAKEILIIGDSIRNVKDFPAETFEIRKVLLDNLRFDDPDLWSRFNTKYASGQGAEEVLSFLEGQANQIVMSRLIGSQKTAKNVISQVLKATQTKTGGKLIKNPIKLAGELNKFADFHLGNFNALHFNSKLIKGFTSVSQTTRNLAGSVLLGSAAIPAAVSDPVFSIIARKARNLETSTPKYLGSLIKNIFEVKKNKQELLALGLGIENIKESMVRQARFMGQLKGAKSSEAALRSVIELSGLNRVTNNARVVNQRDGLGVLTHLLKSKNWGKLDEQAKTFLRKSGFSRRKWKALQEALKDEAFSTDFQDVQLLDLRALLNHKDKNIAKLGLNVGSWLGDFIEAATPTSSVRTKASVAKVRASNVIVGEGLNFMSQFMSFKFSVLNNIVLSNLNSTGLKTGMQYMAAAFTAMTILDILTYQIRDILTGKDPRSFSDPKTWKTAVLNNPFIPPFADVPLNAISGQYRPAGSSFGPAVQKIFKLGSIVGKNATKVIEGKDTAFTSDLAHFLAKNTPVASTLWQTKLIWDRLVTSQITKTLDPKGRSKLRRAITRNKRNGTPLYWKNGDVTPSRLPNIGTMFEKKRK